jgi:hypothetical protein
VWSGEQVDADGWAGSVCGRQVEAFDKDPVLSQALATIHLFPRAFPLYRSPLSYNNHHTSPLLVHHA